MGKLHPVRNKHPRVEHRSQSQNGHQRGRLLGQRRISGPQPQGSEPKQHQYQGGRAGQNRHHLSALMVERAQCGFVADRHQLRKARINRGADWRRQHCQRRSHHSRQGIVTKGFQSQQAREQDLIDLGQQQGQQSDRHKTGRETPYFHQGRPGEVGGPWSRWQRAVNNAGKQSDGNDREQPLPEEEGCDGGRDPGQQRDRAQATHRGRDAVHHVLLHLALQADAAAYVDVLQKPQCGDQAHDGKSVGHHRHRQVFCRHPVGSKPSRCGPDAKRDPSRNGDSD